MPFRGFISVDVPPLPRIAAIMKELRASGGELKIVDLEQLHLTLKFLGSTEETLVPKIVSIIRESVQGLQPFPARVVGTGAFPQVNRMNVLWVGLEDAGDLSKIAASLDDRLVAFGYPREKRPFSAHVTIARVRGRKNQDRVRQIIRAHVADILGETTVDTIRLRRSALTSQGPVYSIVEQVLL